VVEHDFNCGIYMSIILPLNLLYILQKELQFSKLEHVSLGHHLFLYAAFTTSKRFGVDEISETHCIALLKL
jgi:hypothetical protein